MKSMNPVAVGSVAELKQAVLDGRLGPKPDTLTVTGASYIYQTTQFPGSKTKYHNHYLLTRVEGAFGACSHTPDQLEADIAAELSGMPLHEVLMDDRLPVQIAAMDAYLGAVRQHAEHCSYVKDILPGTPIQKAKQRDALIAELSDIRPQQQVALIGVVNPLVEAIRERGGTCLPCDLQLEETQWGDAVERDMNKVLDKADSVICTGMTLGNGSFDRILTRVRERGIPLTLYAQTGSAIAAQFVGQGVTSLVAEPFPFTQFSAAATQLYCYSSRRGS
jgi:hypothetical protein